VFTARYGLGLCIKQTSLVLKVLISDIAWLVIAVLLMNCSLFNFLVPEIFLLFIDQLEKKRERSTGGEKYEVY